MPMKNPPHPGDRLEPGSSRPSDQSKAAEKLTSVDTYLLSSSIRNSLSRGVFKIM
jgi:hypothetical protein